MITEFKNKLAALNRVLSDKNEIQKIRGLILTKKKNKKHATDELYDLKAERNEEKELLKRKLEFLELRNRCFGRLDNFEEETE